MRRELLRVLCLAACAVAAQAQPVTREFAIEAQGLAAALREFSLVTGSDLLFSAEAVSGKNAAEVYGRMSDGDALSLLLQGSGLQFERTPSNAYIIRQDVRTENPR